MISKDGWFDWMIKDPGPLSKTNGGINTAKMCVPHSAEGYWPHLQTLLHSEARRASWMFSNLKDGRCFQHYSIYAQVWGSGSGYPNNNGVMWENEGVAGEPFTPKQDENNIRIIKEVSTLKKWLPRRPVNGADLTATLYEHRECVRFGSEPTACPSGRVPWGKYLVALQEPQEEDVKPLMAWDIGRKRWYFVGPAGARWVTKAATVEELKKQFGPLEEKALSTDAILALGG